MCALPAALPARWPLLTSSITSISKAIFFNALISWPTVSKVVTQMLNLPSLIVATCSARSSLFPCSFNALSFGHQKTISRIQLPRTDNGTTTR